MQAGVQQPSRRAVKHTEKAIRNGTEHGGEQERLFHFSVSLILARSRVGNTFVEDCSFATLQLSTFGCMPSTKMFTPPAIVACMSTLKTVPE